MSAADTTAPSLPPSASDRTEQTWEIINPSDKCFISARDSLVAIAATILLGNGAYGLCAADGTTTMPPLLFGGDAWIAEHFKADLGEWIDAHKPEIADALSTVTLPPGRKRSSLNDIVRAAHAMANRIRGLAEEVGPTP